MQTANECQCLEGVEKMLRTHKEHVRMSREVSESEGEKFDEVPLPPKMKIVEHGDGNLTVTSTGWNTIAKHYNQLIDYLQAHHGKGNG